MNDNPARERVRRSVMVAWLRANWRLWEGYPKPINPPGTRSHALKIFTAMQDAGLFAPRSQCNPLTIARLVADARAAQKLNEVKP